MKRTNKFLKLSAILGLICGLPLAVAAQDPTVAYLCGNVTLTLQPQFSDYTLQPTDEVIWQEVDATGNAVGTPVEQTGASPNLLLSSLSVGEHSYRVSVIPANTEVCAPDVSDDYTVHMLPVSTVSLTADKDAYCEDGPTNTDPAILTATTSTTGGAGLPTGVEYSYTWSATVGGTPVADLTTVGTSNNNVFTMSTQTVGTYSFTVAAKYNVPAGTFFKAEDSNGCEVTGNTNVEVTARPSKPTITFQ